MCSLEILPGVLREFLQEFLENSCRMYTGISSNFLQRFFGSSSESSLDFLQELTENSSRSFLKISPTVPHEGFSEIHLDVSIDFCGTRGNILEELR